MSKKANPTLVGGFVVGAIVLSIIGIMLFGGGTFWEERFDCIVYFDESISGLDVGAPVDFQGVRIGTVTDVWLEFDMERGGVFYRPVRIQLEERRVTYAGRFDTAAQMHETLDALVEQGLRARLGYQSLLTGKLKVDLGFFPGTPIRRLNRDPHLWEMPSISSPFRRVVDEATHLPLSDIVQEAHRAISHVADILDPEVMGEARDDARRVMQRLDSVLAKVEEHFDPMTSQTLAVLQSAQTSLNDLHEAIRNIDNRLEPFLESMTETSDHIGAMLNPQAPTRGELSLLIHDLRETSRSLRRLTDHLEQHPESILRGKK